MAKPGLPPPALLDPGWYPDPTGRYEARFWDGRKWTGNISHYGATGADPLHRSSWDNRLRPRWLFQLLGLLLLVGIAGGIAWYLWPEPSERDLETDIAMAESAVLQDTELPLAWEPAQSRLVTSLDESIKVGEIRFENCVDIHGFADLENEPKETVGFSLNDISTISNRVLVTEDETRLGDFISELGQETSGLCLERLLERALQNGSDATLENTTITLLDPPAFGDEAVWWRITGTFSGGFLPVEITADLITVRVGRSISEFTFLGQFERIGVAVQRDAMRPVTQRLEAGLSNEDTEGN